MSFNWVSALIGGAVVGGAVYIATRNNREDFHVAMDKTMAKWLSKSYNKPEDACAMQLDILRNSPTKPEFLRGLNEYGFSVSRQANGKYVRSMVVTLGTEKHEESVQGYDWTELPQDVRAEFITSQKTVVGFNWLCDKSDK